jgi:hypothetical protein
MMEEGMWEAIAFLLEAKDCNLTRELRKDRDCGKCLHLK